MFLAELGGLMTCGGYHFKLFISTLYPSLTRTSTLEPRLIRSSTVHLCGSPSPCSFLTTGAHSCLSKNPVTRTSFRPEWISFNPWVALPSSPQVAAHRPCPSWVYS